MALLKACIFVICLVGAVLSSSLPEGLACPIPLTFFPTTRTEPMCESTSECRKGELCCRWFDNFHCLQALSTIPKPGMCRAQVENSSEPCRLDFAGCRFDSECAQDKKCCRNINCGYSMCEDPKPKSCTKIGCGNRQAGPYCKNIEEFRPNGPGCEPVCTICKDEITTRKPMICTRRGCGGPIADSNCKNVQITRPNGPGCGPVCRICRDEITTTPRFCTEIGCGPQAGPDCQNVERFRPNGPGCEPVCRICRDEVTTRKPMICTRQGCRGPPANRNCRNVEITRPNGPGCGPVCRICLDEITTTPRFCTKIGCGGPQAGPDCKNVKISRPNGLGCEPVCRICIDDLTTTRRFPSCRFVTKNLCRPAWFAHGYGTRPRCQRERKYVCDEGLF